VTYPAPDAWLRHRGPALVVASIDSWDGSSIRCGATETRWTWQRLLEGAAQAAGLACALLDPRWRDGAIVAEYRDVEILADTHAGRVDFTATPERTLLAYRRCRAAATTAAGTPLLRARVTLLPDEHRP